ncbi:MAG: TonB-dependent receptor [Pseudomonadota bacterium]
MNATPLRPQTLPLALLSALLALELNTTPPAVAADGDTLEAIDVTALRPGMITARQIKFDKEEIVDSIVAADIHAFPDISVSDALQRVTGMQITRDRGEGGIVTLRGLTQVGTTLNGRETFTAGTGRTLDFSDIPVELLAGIDVYKTASANQLEGGVGGLIDLRTWRPLDFKSDRLDASARLIHGDLVDTGKMQYSALASKRWTSASSGQFGALLSLAAQERGWREDQKSTGAPTARTDLIPGQTVYAPNGASETVSLGTRDRQSANLTLQWRPNTALELYAEGGYNEFRTRQQSHQINVGATNGFVDGSLRLFPGTRDLQSITWTDVPFSVLSFARDTVDRNRQVAVGGSWKEGPLKITGDLSHTDSRNQLFFSGPFLAGSAAQFSQDLSGDIPATSLGGTDLLDPGNLRYTGIAYRWRPYEGGLDAARLDGEYRIGKGPIESISVGARLARREADNAPGLIFADAGVSDLTGADMPSYLMPNPYDTMPGSTSIGDYLTGNPDYFRDAQALRDAFGISSPIPASNPLGTWRIRETTQAAYVMARFNAGRVPLDGNFGVRFVRTLESVSGHQSVPSTNGMAPIRIDHDYLDALPSLNLRYELDKDLLLRAGLSKTLSRPNFDQLSPSLMLLRNSLAPSLNQGMAGNPELKPVRSDNLDLALERYFSKTASAHLTGFVKKVDGFVGTLSTPELHDGEAYQVSRPYNTGKADITGLEIGYQQFFDQLPGWMSGLGIQANYTYVDSRTPSTILGRDAPLQNLSRHSYNLVGMYERGRVSTRLAYNWRDTYLSGIAQVVGVGALPVYTKGYGWLDASLSYRPAPNLTLTLEGSNLLGTERVSYYGTPTRPQSVWRNDTQIGLRASVRFR